MKKHLLFMVFIFLIGTSNLLYAQRITSTIEQVKVFLNGAQVQRTAKTTLAAGRSEIVIGDVAADLDEKTLQVKGDGRFTVLSVFFRQNYLEKPKKIDEITRLETLRNQTEDKAVRQRTLLRIYTEEEKILLKNQDVGGSNVGLKLVDLKEITDFHRSRLQEVLFKQLDIIKEIKKLDSVSNLLKEQINTYFSNNNQPIGEVVIAVMAKETTAANFTITYFNQNAGWNISYDLRVKDINSPIALTYNANIYQQTSEEWKNVKLSVSTGNPSEGSVAPTLSAWYLNFGYAYANSSLQNFRRNRSITQVSGVVSSEDGEPLPGVNVHIKGSRIGTVTDMNGSYQISLSNEANILVFSFVGFKSQERPITSNKVDVWLKTDDRPLDEIVVTSGDKEDGFEDAKKDYKREEDKRDIPLEVTEKYQPTTLNFDIKEPFSVPNDGKSYLVQLKEADIEAQYEYFATPKLDKDAFLTAYLTSWQDLNLTEGEINLFVEGTFLGTSVFDLANAGDTLRVSLGRDKNVSVTRTKLKDFSKKKLIGANQSVTQMFEIVVKNNKAQPINIVVEDQFPISRNSQIVVEKLEHKEATIEENTEKVRWRFNLANKKEKKLRLGYMVKYPKNKIVVLE